jgi:hypothetical protein
MFAMPDWQECASGVERVLVYSLVSVAYALDFLVLCTIKLSTSVLNIDLGPVIHVRERT